MSIAISDVGPFSPRRLPDRGDGDDAMLNGIFDDVGDAVSLGGHPTEQIHRAADGTIPPSRGGGVAGPAPADQPKMP